MFRLNRRAVTVINALGFIFTDARAETQTALGFFQIAFELLEGSLAINTGYFH
jgi:hypothetical protein